MTLLEKIDHLLKEHNLNKRQLSVQVGIPYTTIDSFYKKGVENMKLSTFKKLCLFFQVDMTSMAYDELDIKPYDPDVMYTTEHEREVIMRYRASDQIGQTAVDRILEVEDKAERKKEA